MVDFAKLTLEQRITKYANLKAQAAALEEQIKELGPKIIEKLFEDGRTEYDLPGVGKMALSNRTTKTLKPELLILKGVEAAVIEECTVTTTSDAFLTWKAVKPEDALEQPKGR
jgi:hypothetical protein